MSVSFPTEDSIRFDGPDTFVILKVPKVNQADFVRIHGMTWQDFVTEAVLHSHAMSYVAAQQIIAGAAEPD